MAMRRELFNEDEVSKFRLDKLSAFQCAILRHAMTNFPKVKRIVYSTCSVCPEENEAVVEAVLSSTPPNFKPVLPDSGTDWMKSGSSSYNFGTFGLYARSEADFTNGFFVIVFERTDNEYQSGKALECLRDIPYEEENYKKKKKKGKKTSHDLDSNVTSESNTNPVLEKMRKAMENFSSSCVSSEDNNIERTNDLCTDHFNKTGSRTGSKKRKETMTTETSIDETETYSAAKSEKECSQDGSKKPKRKRKVSSENYLEAQFSGICTEGSLCKNSEECLNNHNKKKKKKKTK